jgi:hypothetical protein
VTVAAPLYRPTRTHAWRLAAAFAPYLLLGLVSAVPYLSTLGGYFTGDVFGLVQLFSSKPPLHVLTLFTTPWTERIYGYQAD